MAEDTASRDAPDASRRSEASSADGSDDERRQQAAPGDFDPAAEWDTLTLPPSDPSMDSWAHVWANGRRYAAYRQGRYPLPNDETEQNRDDMKHAIMMELTVRGRGVSSRGRLTAPAGGEALLRAAAREGGEGHRHRHGNR